MYESIYRRPACVVVYSFDVIRDVRNHGKYFTAICVSLSRTVRSMHASAIILIQLPTSSSFPSQKYIVDVTN